MNETINTVFTETTDGMNASVNQLEVTCITSKQNKFHLDSEGNLSVNSITTVVDNSTSNIDINTVYPIGSIYMNTALVDPAVLFGGTWELLKNRFLIGAGDLYAVGTMAGEVNHTLTVSEMPSHTHTQNPHGHSQHPNTWMNVGISQIPKTGGYYYANAEHSADYRTGNTTAINNNTGGSGAHNNMPPYLAVYMWKRVA